MKFRVLSPLAALLLALAVAPAAMASTTLTIKPTAHNFGKTPVGAVRTTTFTIKNTGTTRSAVLSDAISGPGASAYWLGSDSCRGRRLAPGATCRAQIHFSPSAAASYNATYTVTETGTGVSVSAALNGTGTGSSPASLQITPYSYSYVNVVATSSGSQTFTVQNTGGSPTTLASGATLDDQYNVYSIENDNCANVTLAPGATCTFDVRFSPTEMGCCGPGTGYSGDASYASTDSSIYPGYTFFSGYPKPPITLTPSTINFPDTPVGSSSGPIAVTVTNVGGADITPYYFVYDGFSTPEYLQYIDTGDTGNPDYATRCIRQTTVLHPGDTCTLDAYFTPQSEGPSQTTVSLDAYRTASSNQDEYTSTAVTMSGTGTAAP